MTIAIGSSRPASSIPIPGTNHATASSAGACVTAAKAHPGSQGRHRRTSRGPPAAIHLPRPASLEKRAPNPEKKAGSRPAAVRAPPKRGHGLVSGPSRTSACFSSMTSASTSAPPSPLAEVSREVTPRCGPPPRASTVGSRMRTEPTLPIGVATTREPPPRARHRGGSCRRAHLGRRRAPFPEDSCPPGSRTGSLATWNSSPTGIPGHRRNPSCDACCLPPPATPSAMP